MKIRREAACPKISRQLSRGNGSMAVFTRRWAAARTLC